MPPTAAPPASMAKNVSGSRSRAAAMNAVRPPVVGMRKAVSHVSPDRSVVRMLRNRRRIILTPRTNTSNAEIDVHHESKSGVGTANGTSYALDRPLACSSAIGVSPVPHEGRRIASLSRIVGTTPIVASRG